MYSSLHGAIRQDRPVFRVPVGQTGENMSVQKRPGADAFPFRIVENANLLVECILVQQKLMTDTDSFQFTFRAESERVVGRMMEFRIVVSAVDDDLNPSDLGKSGFLRSRKDSGTAESLFSDIIHSGDASVSDHIRRDSA